MQKRMAFDTTRESSQSTSRSAYSDSSAIGVQIMPGIIAEVRIFVSFKSFATDSAKPVTPNFEAQYAELPFSPLLPEPEDTRAPH